MKKLTIILAVFAVVMMPVFAGAATLRGGESYTLLKSETISGNLYAAGADVSFLGDVKGDLSAAGANLTLKGSVGADAAMAGGTIVVDGAVAQDLRVAGGNVTISGPVGGDVAVAGGTVRITAGSKIGGDLLIAGGSVIVEGSVIGDVRLMGGDVTLAGLVGGSVVSQAERLTLAETAVITGNVANKSMNEPVVMTGAVVKGTLTNELVASERSFRDMIAAAGAASFLMFLVFGLLCFRLFKNRSQQFVAHGLAHFGREFLRGLMLLVLLPIFFVSMFLTVVGMPIGIVGLLFYVVVIILAKVFAGIMLGGWINKVLFKKPDQVLTWQTVIGGNVVLFALRFVPVVGGIVSFIFMMLAFGAFWGYLYRHFWVNR